MLIGLDRLISSVVVLIICRYFLSSFNWEYSSLIEAFPFGSILYFCSKSSSLNNPISIVCFSIREPSNPSLPYTNCIIIPFAFDTIPSYPTFKSSSALIIFLEI